MLVEDAANSIVDSALIPRVGVCRAGVAESHLASHTNVDAVCSLCSDDSLTTSKMPCPSSQTAFAGIFTVAGSRFRQC